MSDFETYTPDHLNLWTMPDCYSGETWGGFYVFLMQTRDSDCLERSNFQSALEAIGGENYDAGIYLVRERHWSCGWIEWIAIHSDNQIALRKADEICEALQCYPVVNESHFSELEHESASEVWGTLTWDNRISILRDTDYHFSSWRDMLHAIRDNDYGLPRGVDPVMLLWG